MSNKLTQATTPTVFTTDLAINLLSVVKRNKERFNSTLIDSLFDVETVSELQNLSYFKNLNNRFESELEEYVETGEYGHFTIEEKEALDLADAYQDLQTGSDRFTISEIKWFVNTICNFYSAK